MGGFAIRRSAVLAVVLALGGCADRPPIAMISQFSPPVDLRDDPRETGTCRVHIGEVKDSRSDPASMGQLGVRAVHAGDEAAWLRSGLLSLGRDKHIAMTDDAGASDLVVDAELLKAYIMSMTNTSKAATVVVRVRFSKAGSVADTAVYRGADTSTNWAAGTGETQSAFDDALAQMLADLRRDIVARCVHA
jgi:hypothetical protein